MNLKYASKLKVYFYSRKKYSLVYFQNSIQLRFLKIMKKILEEYVFGIPKNKDFSNKQDRKC